MQNDNVEANDNENKNDDMADQLPTDHMTEATELQGFIVVAKAEGKLLGEVAQIFLDPNEKKIAALLLKGRGWRREKYFVSVDAIELLGEDVILVKDLASCKTYDECFDPKWLSIKDLQGNWITTLEGDHLGSLIDVDFSPKNWVISHLYLSHHQVMEVIPSEVVFGKDEVVVPVHYSGDIVQQERPGFLRRLFGDESFQQVSKAVAKSSKKKDKHKKKKKNSDDDV